MMHELGPESRALLDAAREGLGPDAAAIQRMRAKIGAAIAAGGATGAAAGAGAETGAGAGSGALAVKLGAIALAAAIAVGAVVAIVSLRRGEEATEPRVELPVVRAEPPTRDSAREVPPAAREADPGPEIEMAPLVRAEEARPSPPAPAAPRVEPAPERPAARRADLAREVALVDQAMDALRRGAPAVALDAVRVHAAETAGAGQLAEDAAAIEIEALCHLHDPTVGAKLAAFDARWPQSAQRSRLSTRCP